ncbi:hypothetical protein BC629DRAFT_885412 [Irpex lacteus]|nr:hypothetical protein BC629DRAFT_885412 [Irpex lacteus]
MFYRFLLQISSVLFAFRSQMLPSLSNQPNPSPLEQSNHNSQLLYMLSLNTYCLSCTLLYYRNRSSCAYTRNSTCIQYSMIITYALCTNELSVLKIQLLAYRRAVTHKLLSSFSLSTSSSLGTITSTVYIQTKS